MINILIFPSGSTVAKEIYDSLKYEKNITIYGTDYDNNNFSAYYFENYISGCPFVSNEQESISFLNNIVKNYNIKYIFPAFDNIIEFLKNNEEKIGCKTIASDINTIKICNSKLLTYNLLEKTVNTPIVYNNITDYKILKFPLYCKPIVGYGSRDHKIIKNIEEFKIVDKEKYIITEILSGIEFTVDCFNSKENKLLYCYARERKKTLNGISIQSNTIFIEGIEKIAQKIIEKVPMKGAWFFQVKYDANNNLKLLEIASRIPGAMCVNRVKGVNFSLLSILDLENKNIDPISFNEIKVDCHKTFTNLYRHNLDYKNIYCDLDDTLIIKNKVNTDLIKFLYNCLNNDKKIILITRNENPSQILEKYRLSGIFDNIIKLSKDKKDGVYITQKSTYIEENSLFIDDSYEERISVPKIKKIITISCSELELFI